MKEVFWKTSQKFIEKHKKKKTATQVLSFVIFKIFENNYFLKNICERLLLTFILKKPRQVFFVNYSKTPIL